MHWFIVIAVALFLLFACQDNERPARPSEQARAAEIIHAAEEARAAEIIHAAEEARAAEIIHAAEKARAAERAQIQSEIDHRVELEVAQKLAVQVAAIEKKTNARLTELRTVRIVGFILLAGGSLGSLIWLQRNRSYIPPEPGERDLQMPTWLDHFTRPLTRVLDLRPPSLPVTPAPPVTPALPPAPTPRDMWDEPNNQPRHHRESRRHHRYHNHRNRNHRDQDHDETPRDR